MLFPSSSTSLCRRTMTTVTASNVVGRCGRYRPTAAAAAAAAWSNQPLHSPSHRRAYHVERHRFTPAPTWSHTLSFDTPESDFCHPLPQQQQQQENQQCMPKTLREAMMSRQAVVVTTVEHPHKIVHVNAAWEKLCGYTQQEVLHQTLSVIQGRDTNIVLADATVRQVATTNNTADSTQPKENIVADTYIVNYKKDGSPFKNHICVSTMKLSEDQPDVEFLVGVLEEVDTVPLRLVVV